MTTFFKSLCIALPLTLIGCGSDSSDSPHPIEGRWQTGCEIDDEDNSSFQTVTEIKDGRIKSVSTSFSDIACMSATIESASTITLQITGETTLADGEKAYRAVTQLASLTMKLLTQAQADFYNEYSVCGKEDWQVGVAQDVTICPDSEIETSTGKSIFRVVDNRLYGASDDEDAPLSEDGYPIELDLDNYLTRI